MTDITQCHGIECPLKDNCYRYKAIHGRWQSFFAEIPYKDGRCEHYWPIDDTTLCQYEVDTTLEDLKFDDEKI